TVLAAGANRDPQPATVTVRVAPGERVTATIPLSGVDPDGDRLRLVSVDSPADPQLSTQVVARSNSVQVAASASAERGTHVVGYTVRDAFGGEAQGRLRVMVTEPDGSGSAPVVYSDYVRMVFGATEPAVVRPLDNDLDPSGGTLELVSVVPNVPGGAASLQYQQLADRLDLTSLDDGVVRIHGGDELGTVSFTYTVRSTLTTSTADGLIVVQVSERVGLQAPVVTDTVLSVRDRADFSRVGVDVVTDRVRWAAGDASTLSLSLWGSAAERYRVSGNHILGTYQAEGDLVVFRLAGTDAMGADVETFGFLVVPPLDELRLTLAQGATPLTVAEGESIDVRVTDLLDLGPGDRAELDTAALAVQRPQARCVALNELTVRYSAGREAPWSDTCTIRVKLAEQHTYTVLPVPISIVPDAPVAQLNPLTRTLAPGATETIGLTDMLQWQGGREGRVDQLRWQVTGGATSFEVAQTDAQLRVTARADAVPGSQQQLTVAVTGAGDSQAALTLRVGEAAIDAPRGGTVSLQCTLGSPCTTPLVGVAGEHDPFAGKTGGGLTLVSVDAATCQVGALQAVGNAVQVSWADPRGPGGSCTARFTVHDAQQRIGTGTIELDAQGVPRAPASIVPSGANATSVQLTVTLADRPSHPETTSVEVLSLTGRVVATCTPTDLEAQCWVEGVPVGKAQGRQYLARAVNAVGPSDLTRNPSRATWAYVPPAAPTVTAQVTKDSANTSTTQGEVTLRVEGSARASRFLLTVTPNHTGAPVQIERTSTHRLPPGITSFSVIPQDPDLPPGYDGSTDGAAGEARNVTIGAAPIVTGAQLTQPDPSDATTARLTHGLNENFASEVTLTYGISAPNSASPSGTLAACTSTSPEFTGLTPGTYIGTVCAQSEFGRTMALTSATWLGGDPDPVVVSSGYRIAADPVSSGNSRDYTRVADYSIETLADATVRFALSDGTTQMGTLAQVPVGVTVQVQQCVSTGGG
ncbi:MAG: hypothetical protein GX814_00095, partial [Microbacteriaceae bacterium]|nr:hypothetical protein [Microbacteriaceae bacterium]